MQFASLERLGPDTEDKRFNDELVMFYVRWLQERFPQSASSVSFFSSMFYSELSAPRTRIDYERVKSWVKEDIFGRDHLVIPIHEDGHWYLAIVLDLSSIHVRRSRKTPRIMILDSLGRVNSEPIKRAINNLRKYLAQEAQARGHTATDWHFFTGVHARHAPTQNNYIDCGVYVCGYVEQFLENPADFIRILSDESLEKEWPKIDVSGIRKKLRIQLRALAAEQTAEENVDDQARPGYSVLETTKLGTRILPPYRELSVQETNDLVETIRTTFETDPAVAGDGVLLFRAPHLVSPEEDIVLPSADFEFEGSAQAVSLCKGKAKGILQISTSRAVLANREPIFEAAKNLSPEEMEELSAKMMKSKETYPYFNIDVMTQPCRKGKYRLLCGQPMESLSYIPGISTAFGYYSQGISYFGAHIEDEHFASYNIHFAGQTKLWIAVKPSSNALFERKVREKFPRSGPCSQFVRHQGLYIPPSLLREWGVKFVFVPQKPGDITVVTGHTYHWGINTGHNYAEAINFCMEREWKADKNYQRCRRGCGIRGLPLPEPVSEKGTLMERIASANSRAQAETELWDHSMNLAKTPARRSPHVSKQNGTKIMLKDVERWHGCGIKGTRKRRSEQLVLNLEQDKSAGNNGEFKSTCNLCIAKKVTSDV